MPATLGSSVFCFASDLRDEGMDRVLDNVQARGGLGGLTLAAAHHDAGGIFPHNPVRKVRFGEGGTVFFQPDPERWRGVRLQPRPSSLLHDGDPLDELCRAAAARSLKVRAWAVFLRSPRLAQQHPECAPRNAFGDPYPTGLCPAHPDVPAYARALAADLCRYPIEAVVAESLHYHPLERSCHQEGFFLEPGPLGRFLLGLCFCAHCMASARGLGVDAEAVRRFATRFLERAFDHGPMPQPNVTPAVVEALAGGELGAYARARWSVVASLTREVTGAMRGSGVELSFVDPSGGLRGLATGRPEGMPVVSDAWKLGVDLAGLGQVCDELMVLGYAADPGRLHYDLVAYRGLWRGRLAVALRPMPPDCDGVDNLFHKLRVVEGAGARQAAFHHYGLMPLPALDMVEEAFRR
jgi:hypothetical protein